MLSVSPSTISVVPRRVSEWVRRRTIGECGRTRCRAALDLGEGLLCDEANDERGVLHAVPQHLGLLDVGADRVELGQDGEQLDEIHSVAEVAREIGDRDRSGARLLGELRVDLQDDCAVHQ